MDNTVFNDILAFIPQLYNLYDSSKSVTNFVLELLFFLKL